MKTVAWLLNLNAELELADPNRPAVSSRLHAQIATHGRRFLAVVQESGEAAGFSHIPARASQSWHHLLAWCPTPGAISDWLGAQSDPDVGKQIAEHPSLACLQRVNHRGFLAEFTEGLPTAFFARTMEALVAHLQRSPTPPEGWLLKRAFGFSGRWRKRLGDRLDQASRRWCEASIQGYGGGLQIEPYVPILAEFTLHGLLDPDGSVLRGDPTRLHSDPDGAWVGNQALEERLTDAESQAFDLAFRSTATALHAAGYHGPFGIDGFRWRDERGETRWQALSDLNARFTMGYFVGMHRHHRAVVETCDLSRSP